MTRRAQVHSVVPPTLPHPALPHSSPSYFAYATAVPEALLLLAPFHPDQYTARIIERIVVRAVPSHLLRQRINRTPPSNYRVVQPRAVVILLDSILQLFSVIKVIIFRITRSYILLVLEPERFPTYRSPGHRTVRRSPMTLCGFPTFRPYSSLTAIFCPSQRTVTQPKIVFLRIYWLQGQTGIRTATKKPGAWPG